MADRKKVINAIEQAKKQSEEYTQDKIIVPFKEADMIIALLKEHEAVEPINSYGTFRCGNCRNIVGYNDGHGRGYQNNFCSYCGQAVKWE